MYNTRLVSQNKGQTDPTIEIRFTRNKFNIIPASIPITYLNTIMLVGKIVEMSDAARDQAITPRVIAPS